MTVTVLVLLDNIPIKSFCSAPMNMSFVSLHCASKQGPLPKNNQKRS